MISLMKFIGSFVILFAINPTLTLITFAFIPVIVVYAFFLNKKMKVAFKRNRARIADINSQIEDSLSGIRAVKSFGNEEIEMKNSAGATSGSSSPSAPATGIWAGTIPVWAP